MLKVTLVSLVIGFAGICGALAAASEQQRQEDFWSMSSQLPTIPSIDADFEHMENEQYRNLCVTGRKTIEKLVQTFGPFKETFGLTFKSLYGLAKSVITVTKGAQDRLTKVDRILSKFGTGGLFLNEIHRNKLNAEIESLSGYYQPGEDEQLKWSKACKKVYGLNTLLTKERVTVSLLAKQLDLKPHELDNLKSQYVTWNNIGCISARRLDVFEKLCRIGEFMY